QHQIHHRGQVHCMLSGTSVAPPQLDEFYLAWEPDQKLREPDLEAMGMSETLIWG
ncbi:MAG: damage-inducible protein DinB, partial [Pseudomonadota bacterium]